MTRFGIAAALIAALLSGTVAGCASGGDTGSAAASVDDASISAGVKLAVAADRQLEAADIDVETRAGIVRLSGFVSSAEDVATAAAAARTVKGVQSVRNDLRLR